jgi:hypothetical protein
MFKRFILSLVPAAVVLAGCSGAPAKAAPTVLTLSDFAIAAPATIPASMATFTVINNGNEAHQAALVRLDSGKTLADFQSAMKAEGKGPPPSWIVWMGGANAIPHDTNNVTIALEAGTYVWYCIIPGADGVPHVMKGMSAPMTVTANTAAMDAAPAADIEVSMKDYQWEMSMPVTAGRHTFKISAAAGAQPHEWVLVRLQEGKTAQDFVNWAMTMKGAPPVESLGGVPVMQPGQVNYTTADFKAGHYALVCFVPDAKDGQPHAMHGMVREFTVQ